MSAPQGQWVQQPVYVAAPRPTSGLAVAGFVMALLGISLPAAIMCFVAMSKTKSGEQSGHGLAVAGAVIGVLGTLAWCAIVLPFFWVMIVGAAGAGAS